MLQQKKKSSGKKDPKATKAEAAREAQLIEDEKRRAQLNANRFRAGKVTAGAASMLWDADADKLVAAFQVCLQLNEQYHMHYTKTAEKLAITHANDPSKQFHFNQQKIFGTFDVFCRRIIKVSRDYIWLVCP